ncbi:hypothetical protein SAMN05216197_13815 [Pseudomonas graminis]|uniref:Uncharacterized protein n=1 Tax=Pseudomonas graminis TaxID=158627 RepID=A0A1I0IKC7_9PSED|nr:hypothetical protein SAMN05216197_13815 [Pseudomonas graminis]
MWSLMVSVLMLTHGVLPKFIGMSTPMAKRPLVGIGRESLGGPLQIQGAQTGLFPAEAGPTNSMRVPSGTGFSREGVGGHSAKWRVPGLASSRLKPAPLTACEYPAGPASAGKASVVTPQNRGRPDWPIPG